jgi:uncharacterized protein YndB with AHSA1/START domain
MTTQTVIAILAASAMVFVIGGVWYAPAVFGRRWMDLNGISYDDLHRRGMGRVFGGSFLLALVMTVNLAMFLGPDASLAFATAAGAAAGIGWTAAGLGITYLFERRPLKLWLINGGYHAVTLTAVGAVLGLFSTFAHPKAATSAEIRTTSYALPTGERVLRHEFDVDASPAAVWRALTTNEGLHGYVAAVASIDLRPGGFMETSYDPHGHLGDAANILNEVIAYVPERLLSMRIARTPPNFPHAEVARQVWSVIEIADLGRGRSHLTTSMYGWKQGEDWDAVYTFFERGNRVTAQHLQRYLSGQPVASK